MNKQRWMIAVVLVLALLAIPASAFAQDTSAEGSTTARGAGVLHAHGDGTVTIRLVPHDFDPPNQFNATGDGVLHIVDFAGDANITVNGEGERHSFDYQGYTGIVYRGFNGRVEVSGSSFAVRLRGTGITLDAQGAGWVRLVGEGEYQTSGIYGGNNSGVWTEAGTTVNMGQ